MRYVEVAASVFLRALSGARAESELVRKATTAPKDMPKLAKYFLAVDGRSGFGLNGDELIGVHSLARGRGDEIVSAAVSLGAKRLDCFDGYLPGLYAKHGFRVASRVPNWTPGEPDVVFMELVA